MECVSLKQIHKPESISTEKEGKYCHSLFIIFSWFFNVYQFGKSANFSFPDSHLQFLWFKCSVWVIYGSNVIEFRFWIRRKILKHSAPINFNLHMKKTIAMFVYEFRIVPFCPSFRTLISQTLGSILVCDTLWLYESTLVISILKLGVPLRCMGCNSVSCLAKQPVANVLGYAGFLLPRSMLLLPNQMLDWASERILGLLNFSNISCLRSSLALKLNTDLAREIVSAWKLFSDLWMRTTTLEISRTNLERNLSLSRLTNNLTSCI